MPGLALAEARTAVATAVVECSYLAIATPHDDHRIMRQVEAEIIAGLFHMGNRASIKPDRFKHDFGIEGERVLPDVKLLRERMAQAVGGEQRGNSGKARHWLSITVALHLKL